MPKKLILSFLGALLVLTACQMRGANRFTGGGRQRGTLDAPSAILQATPTNRPTRTPEPQPTITPTQAPDPSLIGLSPEQPGTTALDFVDGACKAEWSNANGPALCDAPADPSAGYIMRSDGDLQGLPSAIPVLLTFPPLENGDTLRGLYPVYAVQKGDRFRAVLTCQTHTFCDVEFGLEYVGSPAGTTGSLGHWSYLFTDQPRVVDTSLDGIAGLSVQFRLAVRRHGDGQQAYAVWLMPHIYRPVH